MKSLLKSEILRRARPMIASGEETFICYALWNLEDSNRRVAKSAVSDIIHWIMEQLNGSLTLARWIANNDLDSLRSPGEYPFIFERRCRLAWIDWMIKQYEAYPEINSNRRRKSKCK